jgi:hypothetical protein
MDSSGIEGKTSFVAILFILFHRVFLLVDHIFYLHPTSSEWREVQKMISPHAFLALAQTITKTSHTTARHKARSRFVSTFGSKPSLVSELWNLLEVKKLPRGFRPIHLLWTLCFVKLYASEATLSSLCGCDEKTFRKWVRCGLEIISDLDLVSCVQTLLPFA